MKLPVLLKFACFQLLLVFALMSSIVKAEEASIVKISEWGSNNYESGVKIGQYYYFLQENSNKIDVYQVGVNGYDALIGHLPLELDDPILNIEAFDEHLVLVTFNTLYIYSVDGIETPTNVYGVAARGTRVNGHSYFFKTDSSLYYLSDDHKVYGINKVQNDYELGFVYDPQYEGTNETSDSVTTLGVHNDVLTVAFYRNYNVFINVNSVNMPDSLVVFTVDISSDTPVELDSYEIELTDEYHSDLKYLGDGWISLLSRNPTEGNKVHFFKEIENTFSLQQTHALDGRYTSHSMDVLDNELWVVGQDRSLVGYDISRLPEVVVTRNLEIQRGDDFYSLQVRSFKAVSDDRLFVFAFNSIQEVILEDEGEATISDLFYRGGSARSPAIIGNKVLLPLWLNRVIQLDTSDVLTPSFIKMDKVANDWGRGFVQTGDTVFALDSHKIGIVNVNGDDVSISDALNFPNPVSSTYSFSDNYLYLTRPGFKFIRYDLSSHTSVYELPLESPDIESITGTESFYEIARAC